MFKILLLLLLLFVISQVKEVEEEEKALQEANMNLRVVISLSIIILCSSYFMNRII